MQFPPDVMYVVNMGYAVSARCYVCCEYGLCFLPDVMYVVNMGYAVSARCYVCCEYGLCSFRQMLCML